MSKTLLGLSSENKKNENKQKQITIFWRVVKNYFKNIISDYFGNLINVFS